MLSPDRITDLTPLAASAADYDVVRRAIGHIRGHWREQPEIETIAEAAGVTPTELHHLFRRWAGLSPKAFLQALTLHGARELLRDSASVLDATYEVGLSGPGRLVGRSVWLAYGIGNIRACLGSTHCVERHAARGHLAYGCGHSRIAGGAALSSRRCRGLHLSGGRARRAPVDAC